MGRFSDAYIDAHFAEAGFEPPIPLSGL